MRFSRSGGNGIDNAFKRHDNRLVRRVRGLSRFIDCRRSAFLDD